MQTPSPSFHAGTGNAASGRHRPPGREGAALAVVLIVLVVILLLGLGLLQLSGATAFEASKTVSTTQAFWAAEAGLEHIKAIGNKRKFPYNLINVRGRLLYGRNVLQGSTANGRYTVDVEDAPGWTNAGNLAKKYLLRSTGTSNGNIRQVVETIAEIETFASYMHASDSEETPGGGNIYFGPQDILDGDIYTNDQLNLWGSGSNTPQLLGLTRSAASSVNYQGSATSDSFVGGLELGVDKLDFAGDQFGTSHIDSIKSTARAGGLVLSGNYEFIFNADSSFTYTPLGGGPTETGSTTNLNFNGAIYVDGDIQISGVVRGNVTLASDDDIRIMDDLVYESAQSPTPFQAAFSPAQINDSLGLIARDQVEIQGSSDINIHAAVLVTEGNNGFGAANRYVGMGSPRINLYGSISQNRRGVVGTVSGLGFRKNYRYNTTFLDRPPQYWPYTLYSMTEWEYFSKK